MKQILLIILSSCALWAAVGAIRFVSPTTYYVSNAASNGYVRGSDKNSGLTPASPFLTFSKAVKTSSMNGDTIMGNPSGQSYDENTGNLGLGLVPNGNSVTIEADPRIGGNVIITAAASNWILSPTASKNPLSLANITFDGLHAISGINPRTTPISLNSCVFQNIPAGSAAVIDTTPDWNITLNKCTFASTVADGIVVETSSRNGLSVQGCKSAVSDKFIQTGGNGVIIANIVVTNASDGTRTSHSGADTEFFNVNSGGTITNLTIDHTDLGSMSRGFYTVPSAGTGTSTFGSIKVDNCTATGVYTLAPPFDFLNVNCSSWDIYSNSFNSTGGILIGSEQASNVNIQNNTFVALSTGGQFDCISVGPVGPHAVITGNTISNNNATSTSTHGLMFGIDGPYTDSSNTVGTGIQNLGDGPSDLYLDQTFTTSSPTFYGRSSTIEGILVTVAKHGSPSSLTATLSTDSSGVPGSLIEASPTLVAGTAVSSEQTQFFFEFRSHTFLLPSTKYHLTLTATGVDSNDYFVFGKNTSTVSGPLATSQNGSKWVQDTSHALLYAVLNGCFAATGALVYNNTVICASSGNDQNHGLLCGCVPSPTVYHNRLIGGGPVMPIKDCYGGLWYDNLVFTSIGTQAPLAIKGSFGCTVLHCTMISTSPTMTSVALLKYDQSLGANAPGAANNAIKNCILIANPTTGSGWIYNLQTAGPGNSINYNAAYPGPKAQVEGSTWPTWAKWQAAGFDTKSISKDPHLNNENAPLTAADFEPIASSPVSGIGTNELSLVPTDFLGNSFTTTPAAGAFSYTSFH